MITIIRKSQSGGALSDVKKQKRRNRDHTVTPRGSSKLEKAQDRNRNRNRNRREHAEVALRTKMAELDGVTKDPSWSSMKNSQSMDASLRLASTASSGSSGGKRSSASRQSLSNLMAIREDTNGSAVGGGSNTNWGSIAHISQSQSPAAPFLSPAKQPKHNMLAKFTIPFASPANTGIAKSTPKASGGGGASVFSGRAQLTPEQKAKLLLLQQQSQQNSPSSISGTGGGASIFSGATQLTSEQRAKLILLKQQHQQGGSNRMIINNSNVPAINNSNRGAGNSMMRPSQSMSGVMMLRHLGKLQNDVMPNHDNSIQSNRTWATQNSNDNNLNNSFLSPPGSKKNRQEMEKNKDIFDPLLSPSGVSTISGNSSFVSEPMTRQQQQDAGQQRWAPVRMSSSRSAYVLVSPPCMRRSRPSMCSIRENSATNSSMAAPRENSNVSWRTNTEKAKTDDDSGSVPVAVPKEQLAAMKQLLLEKDVTTLPKYRYKRSQSASVLSGPSSLSTSLHSATSSSVRTTGKSRWEATSMADQKLMNDAGEAPSVDDEQLASMKSLLLGQHVKTLPARSQSTSFLSDYSRRRPSATELLSSMDHGALLSSVSASAVPNMSGAAASNPNARWHCTGASVPSDKSGANNSRWETGNVASDNGSSRWDASPPKQRSTRSLMSRSKSLADVSRTTVARMSLLVKEQDRKSTSVRMRSLHSTSALQGSAFITLRRSRASLAFMEQAHLQIDQDVSTNSGNSAWDPLDLAAIESNPLLAAAFRSNLAGTAPSDPIPWSLPSDKPANLFNHLVSGGTPTQFASSSASSTKSAGQQEFSPMNPLQVAAVDKLMKQQGKKSTSVRMRSAKSTSAMGTSSLRRSKVSLASLRQSGHGSERAVENTSNSTWATGSSSMDIRHKAFHGQQLHRLKGLSSSQSASVLTGANGAALQQLIAL